MPKTEAPEKNFYSERQAAVALGEVAQTLSYWRKKEWLRTDLFQHVDQPAARARPILRYDKTIVDAAAAGTDTIFAEEYAEGYGG